MRNVNAKGTETISESSARNASAITLGTHTTGCAFSTTNAIWHMARAFGAAFLTCTHVEEITHACRNAPVAAGRSHAHIPDSPRSLHSMIMGPGERCDSDTPKPAYNPHGMQCIQMLESAVAVCIGGTCAASDASPRTLRSVDQGSIFSCECNPVADWRHNPAAVARPTHYITSYYAGIVSILPCFAIADGVPRQHQSSALMATSAHKLPAPRQRYADRGSPENAAHVDNLCARAILAPAICYSLNPVCRAQLFVPERDDHIRYPSAISVEHTLCGG